MYMLFEKFSYYMESSDLHPCEIAFTRQISGPIPFNIEALFLNKPDSSVCSKHTFLFAFKVRTEYLRYSEQ